ncbi:MAG: amino acid ABC transporter permease, partial [Erysipelothrix sp.]|nr:amino acid ABC transporter permease [Erysipelothrix sp.]
LVVLKRSPFLVFQQFARAYVEIIRGTPLLVQIIFFFYIIGTAFNISNRLMAGVIILSIFESAYIGEILRGGLNSIESKQNEIAKSLGLNRWQTLRLIIIPQLFIRVLPALTGQFASVIKDSSLLSMIALIELTQVTKEITANNFNSYFVSYITLALLYLTLTFPISLLANTLEKRSQYET